jgi:hypothetical protein
VQSSLRKRRSAASPRLTFHQMERRLDSYKSIQLIAGSTSSAGMGSAAQWAACPIQSVRSVGVERVGPDVAARWTRAFLEKAPRQVHRDDRETAEVDDVSCCAQVCGISAVDFGGNCLF